ncbi:type IV secretion system DNA-binding domain-containing protein [Aquamicrobium sp.]|uniref:type IV secretion system DNA-binding domain-containing protein n=1 Tax=Aquamicrobium sp. TaxID=1872579 RepID=UPI0025883DDB|nr:type IV secretion system DNA-binding domain-containing protein [Aquamicrobium sp.]MCK9549492.1 type IV secretion system DNA-binding domain-containing protein [Aquamicrobium sp.]
MRRGDIRFSGKPIHLRHHSARGTVQRNSGNFTRGSQLLTHEVLMWTSGAKIPFIVWAFGFAAAYSFILVVTLREHEIGLIGMKLYSLFWNFMEFDPMKRVNVTLPDGSIRAVVMAQVPDVPAVIAAWAKAMRGLFGAFLLSLLASIPLSIWFVDISRKRGQSILQERHERGAMLVERDILHAEIIAHNRSKFESEAAELFPGSTPAQVLAMPFAQRKEAGIHHPYLLAGIPYPHRMEQSHAMLLGTTGAGKTTQLRSLLEQMRARQDTAVVFDLTGAYVEAFYDAERDTILNPMDQRCQAWTIFNDCTSYSNFTTAAAALIPSDGGSSDPFWARAARTLFVEMCIRLQERGLTTNQALSENLMTADLKRVHRFLVNTIADPITAPEAARMAESIRAVFNTNGQVLRFLPDEGEPFSIRKWMTRDKQPGSILFITSSYDDIELNRPLLTLWMDIAINSLMSLPRTEALRNWFLFDELGALHRLPAIEKGLQTARNYGGAMVLGLHSFQKLVEVYGEDAARNLSSLARTKLILASGDFKTAEECSQYIGNREVRQMDEAYSYGYNQTRDASTLTPRKQVEPLVLPDDITNLPATHGYVKFPDGFPAARIMLVWKRYPKVAEPFMLREFTAPPRRRSGSALVDEDDGDSGGRDGAAQVVEDADRPNPARDLAAGILSVPPEEMGRNEERDRGDPDVDRARPGSPGATAPNGRHGRERAPEERTEREESDQRGRDRTASDRARGPEIEDQTLRELREDYGPDLSADRDDMDMGI